MFKKGIAYLLITTLIIPNQLLVVWANTGEPRMSAQLTAAGGEAGAALEARLNRSPLDLEDLTVATPPTPPVTQPPSVPPVEPPTAPPVQPPPVEPPVDPIPSDPVPTEPINGSQAVKNMYICLLRELQHQVSHGGEYRYASVQPLPTGALMGNQREPVIGFDVTIDYTSTNVRLGRVVYNPFQSCRVQFNALQSQDKETIKHELLSILDADQYRSGIMSEYTEVQPKLNLGQSDPRYVLNNSEKRIIFKPTRAYSKQSQSYAVKTALRSFFQRGGSGQVLDDNFARLDRVLNNPSSQLVKPSNWLVALRMKLSYIGSSQSDMEADAIGQVTDSLVNPEDDARRRAEEAQKREDRREMWGNIAKVGLAIGGGILAWKLIDSLNKDDEDEDDDKFDGPMFPPHMMQPPYMPYPPGPMYPPGMGMYPPGMMYPPGPMYPPQTPYPPGGYPQQPPMPQPMPQPYPGQPPVGQDYGSLLVELDAKLQNIIKLQRELITTYIQRTNVNMTDSDKDNFRRILAQIDGEIRIVNPMIAQMENSPVPANSANMGAINEKRAAVYRYVQEVKNNDRIIKEFNASMNISGTGLAGPASAGTSPMAAAPNLGAQPWQDPTVRGLIDQYLRENKLNRWGYPDTPGVIQHTPPAAMGKEPHHFVWENPKVQAYVTSKMQAR